MSIGSYSANFTANYIVKRDQDGRWCYWDDVAQTFVSLLDTTLLPTNSNVYRMAKAPDGRVYVAGKLYNVAAAPDWGVARFTTANVLEGVAKIDNAVHGGYSTWQLLFTLEGKLLTAGAFDFIGTNGTTAAKNIALLSDLDAVSITVETLGTCPTSLIYVITEDASGNIYVGGTASDNVNRIQKWNGSAWSSLSTGLNNTIRALAIGPDGYLYIGGLFTNADGTYGDYLCYWDGTAFHRIGTVELNGAVYSIAFDHAGRLIAGGDFNNASGISNANYIARWNGTQWEALGDGLDGRVTQIVIDDKDRIYAAGYFTKRVKVLEGGIWISLDIDLPYGVANDILVADEELYIAGNFAGAATSGVVSYVASVEETAEADPTEDPINTNDWSS